MTVENKVALITGAAHRIGACTTRKLHALGYRVVIHYRGSEDGANALALELNTLRSGSAHCLQANLDDISEVEQLAREAIEYWGRLDLLVNNASSFFPTPVGNIDSDNWDALIGSNLKGPLFLSQATAPSLKQQQGCIINIVDIHAEKPMSNHTVYCIAKAGLAMMTKSLARELAPEVRVNGVSPGAILWPDQGNILDGEGKNHILDRVPLSRTGEPEDIAQMICFLAEQAPYITGQIIAVDGGRSVQM